MLLRANQGRRPQITFTSDFHELVEGDLIAGPCVLRYDPLRLVSAETYPHDHHVSAHVRFHPNLGSWDGVMTLPAGVPLAVLADPAGQGFMLETVFTIPNGCQELEAWFSCTHDDGTVHWDSKMGRNYWLRFPLKDLEIRRAANVKKTGTGHDALELEIGSAAATERVDVRWRFTHPAGVPRKTTTLVAHSDREGRKIWNTPPGGIPIAEGATVVFDVVYTIGGHQFTDDNQGNWYLVENDRK